MSKNILQKLSVAQEGIYPTLPFFLNALKSIHEGVLFLSLDGKLLFMNQAAKKMLNPPEERGLFWDIFPDDYFGFSMKEALHFGLFQEKNYRRISSRELEISCSFSFDGPKHTHGFLLLIADITPMQELKTKLQHSERLQKLGEMVATITHEIRNPLGGIRGYASLLSRDLSEQKHLQEMAGFIIDGTRALERLVSNVLQFAKPVEIDPKVLDVNQFVRQFVKFLKADPSKPSLVQLDVHIPEDPTIALIDKEAMHLVLLNLVFNAYQAMSSGGTLTLSLLKIDSCFSIAISDTGIGMDEEKQKHIFSPFFTTKKEGNGIGLSEVQKIIKAHDGTIEIRSTPMRGTTFTLQLPRSRVSV